MAVRYQWKIIESEVCVKEVIPFWGYGIMHKGTYRGRDVAVKFLRNPEDLAMFNQEVSFWFGLDHPNIAKVALSPFIGATYDSSRMEFRGPRLPNVCGIVSEYFSRGTVYSYLSSKRPNMLNKDVIGKMVLDVARGLNYLHKKRIIHGDVEPSNLVMDTTGTVKIIHFDKSHNVGDGNTGGHIRYRAPEVIRNKTSSLKADVYSFGITLGEICHNERPYKNVRTTDIPQEVLHNKARPEISNRCPRQFVFLMKSCWDADPQRRPSMDDVVSNLIPQRR